MAFSPPSPTSSSLTTKASLVQPVPKSIFASKTVWGIIFTVVASIAPLIAQKIDDKEFYARDAAQIIVILCGAGAAIVGRVEAGSIYTPKFMPGPDRDSFNPPA